MNNTSSSTAVSSTAVVVAAVAATISTVLPGFLAGALSVQADAEFVVGEAVYGWALGGFFLAAAVSSTVMGRVAQAIGPRRQVTAALLVSAVGSIAVAAFASSFLAFCLLMAVLGVANSANQSAINLLLAQAKIDRLGLAIAFKQSGMPAAALLGGLAVPSIAITVGWRWVYVVGAGLALLALVGVRMAIAPVGKITRQAATVEPMTPRSVLRFGSIGFGCLAFAAGALNAWTVASGVDAGLSEGAAGLLLSGGAFVGVVVRLTLGTRIDAMTLSPMSVAAALSVIGACGVGALAIRSPVAVLLATLLAFGTGWVWPVLTNFAIIRANQDAAAAATGVTQTGVYTGVFVAPLVSGYLIDEFSFTVMWAVTAVIMLLGGVIVHRLSNQNL